MASFGNANFQTLKASLNLLCPEGGVSWWHGIVKSPVTQEDCVVLIVDKEHARKIIKETRVVAQYHAETYEGPSSYLVAMPVMHFDKTTLDGVGPLPDEVIERLVQKQVEGVDHEASQDEAIARMKWQLISKLQALGVADFEMRFSGEGDSGNPDEFSAYRGKQWWPKDYHNERAKAWAHFGSVELGDELEREISEWVWETHVDRAGCDIVNNDGGGGRLEIVVDGENSTMHIEIWTNEIRQNTEMNEDL